MERPWAVLAGGACWGLTYFLVPVGVVSESVWLVGLATLVAVLARAVVRMSRPRLGWVAILAAVTCTALGDVVFAYNAVVAQVEPFPSVGDVLYLASYPLMAFGLTRLARCGRGRRRLQPVIDGLILSGVAALAVWMLFVAPVFGDASEPMLTRMIAAAYPVGDLLLLVTCTQLLVHRTRPAPALWLIVAATLSNLFADIWFLYLDTYASYSVGQPVDALWALAYVLVVAAALHPSAATIAGGTDAEAAADLRPGKLLILAVAALAAPVLLTVLHIAGNDRHDRTLLIGTCLLFGLVIGRLWLVARDLELSRAELRHRATHDELTGLGNRSMFNELLEVCERHPGQGGAVMLIDLDAFKHVNDTRGHSAGDAVLREVAIRLRACVPAGSTVARIGGDEFAVLLPADADVELVADRLVSAVRQPIDLDGGHSLRTSISCGIAMLAGDDPVLHRADEALYEAKRGGRDGYVVAETGHAAV